MPGQPVLVLPPRHSPDSQAIWRAALHAGWDIERLANWRAPTELRGRDLVFYGEPLFVNMIADQLGAAVLDISDSWLPGLDRRWLRRDVVLSTLGTARALQQPTFVKPPNEKLFPADVYASGIALPGPDVLPDNTPVLTSSPVHWEAEFRCFIRERRLATHSIYARDGSPCQAEDGQWLATSEEHGAAGDFCTELLDAGIDLPAAVVVDVGLIRGQGWAVIEANAAWGSGIYGCDPDAVLATCRRACRRSDELSAADAVWVR